MSDARTLRQRLVAEIGEQGQARIASSSAHASSDIEARYLAFAGFREVHTFDAADAHAASDDTFVAASFRESDPSVRELATSAARALVQIKKAAGVAR
jgi:hypothetical protein